jgi:hypothetical protein
MIARSIDKVYERDAATGSVLSHNYTRSLDAEDGFTEYINEQGSTTRLVAPAGPAVRVFYRAIGNLFRSWAWRKSQTLGVKLDDSSSSQARTDSDISLYSLTRTKTNGLVKEKIYQSLDPICLVLAFDDHTYTKFLEYKTFAQWHRFEALLLDLESDGICVDYLWDIAEDMRVTGGDWDARVRPGWEVHASCTDCSDIHEYPNDRVDEDSSVDDDWERDLIESGYYRQEWWFARWRHRVESRRSRGASVVHDPSWRMIIAVCGLMIPFLWAMVIFLA